MNNQLLVESFKLTKKSLIVSLLGAFLYLAAVFTPKFSVLPMLVSFFYTAFALTVPVFLVQIQNNQGINIKDYINLTRNTFLKSFATLLAIYIVLVLLTLSTSFILLSPSSINATEKLLTTFLNSNGGLIFLPLSQMFLALFAFTPIFFSIEKLNLLNSLRKSVIFAFKNWICTLFVSLLLMLIPVVDMITNEMTTYTELSSRLSGEVFLSIFISITMLFVSALCLIYWQKTKV